MYREEQTAIGIANAKKYYPQEEIKKIVEQYKITRVKFTLGCEGRWSRRSRLDGFNDNAPKYKNRPVWRIEQSLKISEDAYIREVYKMFSDYLKQLHD